MYIYGDLTLGYHTKFESARVGSGQVFGVRNKDNIRNKYSELSQQRMQRVASWLQRDKFIIAYDIKDLLEVRYHHCLAGT